MFRTDIESLLLSLATERRLFWSEADFQFAFAWKIQQNYPSAKIRLERRQEITNSKKPAYVEIWVELDNKIYPIELKYKTRIYQAADLNGEVIRTKTHSARDVGRHSYLKDIERIENYSYVDGFERGFAIIITNDEHYYNPELAPSGTTDEDFVIHEGKTIKRDKKMVWHSSKPWALSLGSITLRHDYQMKWSLYSRSEDNKGDFKYAIAEINK